MKLSAPIHRLKSEARQLARVAGIPLHDALDRIAAQEGYPRWSLLAQKEAALSPAARTLARLKKGDLLLLGARPGEGKTLLGLTLLIEALRGGGSGTFFTLEYSEADVLTRLTKLGADPATFGDHLGIVTSDAISADYIIDHQRDALPGSLIVIDYLQILDQDRRKPDLGAQVKALKDFAASRDLILVFLSQIDRSYDPAQRRVPEMTDIRLPNPIDLALFSKACFLANGELRFQSLS